LKVDIRDGAALAALSPEAIDGYLENTGWERRPGLESLYSSWTKTVGAEEIELLVPSQRSVADYQARIADLLHDLEHVEQRSQLTLFEDLLTANADVLRIILRGPSYRTSLLPIDTVGDVIRAAKDLLLAAACSTVKVEPFYPTRPPKAALDFLRRVRLSAAEYGSVNLKFFAEVPAAQRFPFDEQLPFARAAMLTLHSALDFTSAAQGTPIFVNRERLTLESLQSGVSANLCEALVALCGDFSDDHAVELIISYAPALPVKPAARRAWRFRPSERDFLKALGQHLRESGVDDDYHLVGFVHAIKQPWRDDEYLATILAWIREKVTRVNVHLDVDQGALATQAFQKRIPIECVGRLQEHKQTFSLDHPHDVKLYSYPEDPLLEPLRKPPASAEPGPLEFFETKKERKRPR
jgi:hypothetical protein